MHRMTDTVEKGLYATRWGSEKMVAAGRKYQVIDMQTGQLDRRIFVDPDIYAEEQEKVFGRAWLMIGHESLVPKPNDYSNLMGEEPVSSAERKGNCEPS